jgi:hypothetical protein
MLLSDWYVNWKEKRIKAAAQKARAEGFEEGYAAGKTGKSGDHEGAQSGKDAHVVVHGRKSAVVTHGQKKK